MKCVYVCLSRVIASNRNQQRKIPNSSVVHNVIDMTLHESKRRYVILISKTIN